MSTTDGLKVFIGTRDSECELCHLELPRGRWFTLVPGAGARCLSCADLDELVFLPSGNTALTRRAGALSALSAVVLKWSRSRKRYERQGLLVQEAALSQAEAECLADADARALSRERQALRRAELDEQYVADFAAQIRALFPRAPRGRERAIAEHACRIHSGRVGRSAAAKQLDEEAVRLAVIAHLRHAETEYDRLLGSGCPRDEARKQVAAKIDRILDRWQAG